MVPDSRKACGNFRKASIYLEVIQEDQTGLGLFQYQQAALTLVIKFRDNFHDFDNSYLLL